jgi:type VI secretion system secreted protein Hcp
MRKLSLAAFFCISLAAASEAAAQSRQNFVYTVEGWPKMAGRADGKGEMLAWGWGLSDESTPSATAKPTPGAGAKFHDLSMTTWLDDRVVLFMRHSLEGRPLKTVLIELFPASAKPAPRAPFAIRLSDVRVTGVTTGGSAGEDRLTANVRLSASKVEIYTAHQTATGTTQPGQQLGWDIKAGKGM